MLVTLLQEKTKKALQDKHNNIEKLATELFEQFKKNALVVAGECRESMLFILEAKYRNCKKLFEDRLTKEGLEWKERSRPDRIGGWEYTISWESMT